jgi:hypothetical protein
MMLSTLVFGLSQDFNCVLVSRSPPNLNQFLALDLYRIMPVISGVKFNLSISIILMGLFSQEMSQASHPCERTGERNLAHSVHYLVFF